MSTVLSPQTVTSARLDPALVAEARVVLCDLDGCLMSEGQALPGAADFVAACGARLWIVSNNSTHSAEALSEDLARLGLTVPAARILLAGEQTLRHLARHRPGFPVAIFGSATMEAEAARLGLLANGAAPEIAVLFRDTQLSLPRLTALAALVHGGVELWVTNLDTSHPGAQGQPVPETGALLAALRAMLGPVSVHSLGKPHPHMADHALKQLGLSVEDAVFVGDNPDTDGALAAAMGLRFVHLDRAGAGA